MHTYLYTTKKEAFLHYGSMVLSSHDAVSRSHTANLSSAKIRSVAVKLRRRWSCRPTPHLLARPLHCVIVLTKQTSDFIQRGHLQKPYEIAVSCEVTVLSTVILTDVAGECITYIMRV
jgi:hypothetical protein